MQLTANHGTPPRILFVLHEPGYFRLYGSAIVELGRRGCEVLLAFDRPDKRGASSQVPAGAGAKVRSIGALPGAASPFAAALRVASDYVRYLEPAFAHASYLRRRAEKHLPPAAAFLTRMPILPRWIVSTCIAAGRVVERLIPVNRDVLDFVRRAEADVIVVSPVVIIGESGARQTEVIKAGRAAAIPVVVGAASWDHLTSKGLVRVVPDAVTVWNRAQAREAEDLHRIPRSRIVVTGAQSLDHWFDPTPPAYADALRRRLGIDAASDVVLFVGSSRNMAPGESEVRFVRRWLTALRASSAAALRNAAVIIRPHPTNCDAWCDVDLGDARAVVHPRQYSGIPLSDEEVETFRQSLLLSAAVVGVNTTAMIEAAILRRPVLTIHDAEFTHSQQQTVHFGYLSDGESGCARTAASLEEHVQQLAEVLRDPRAQLQASERFVGEFVRPGGTDRSATARFCDAIEAIARGTAPAAAAEDVEQPAAAATAATSTPPPWPSIASADEIAAAFAPYVVERMATDDPRWHAEVARIEKKYARPAGAEPGRWMTEAGSRTKELVQAGYESRWTLVDLERQLLEPKPTPFEWGGQGMIAHAIGRKRVHLLLLARVLERLRPASVLEVGFGNGLNLLVLSMQFPEVRFSGVELTAAGVAAARALAGDPKLPSSLAPFAVDPLRDPEAPRRLSLQQGSADKLPVADKSVDMVITVLALEQMERIRDAALRELTRVARHHVVMIEPFADWNAEGHRQQYIRRHDYFAARLDDLPRLGLVPLIATADMPHKLAFRAGLVVARVDDGHAVRDLAAS